MHTRVRINARTQAPYALAASVDKCRRKCQYLCMHTRACIAHARQTLLLALRGRGSHVRDVYDRTKPPRFNSRARVVFQAKSSPWKIRYPGVSLLSRFSFSCRRALPVIVSILPQRGKISASRVYYYIKGC